MRTERFTVDGKAVTLYRAEAEGCPLIVLNTFDEDGEPVARALTKAADKDFNLLCIGNLNWNHDMTPWQCPPIFAQDAPYTGGADEYLKLLTERIIPQALARIPGAPAHISIAGYSLAGLFALYALYHTDIFERAASMSGSLWFPGFPEYVLSHTMKKVPGKLYISLGDKEAKTRNKYFRTIRENTEKVAAFYRDQGIDVTFEMNPGNHFTDPEGRSTRGILALLG